MCKCVMQSTCASHENAVEMQNGCLTLKLIKDVYDFHLDLHIKEFVTHKDTCFWSAPNNLFYIHVITPDVQIIKSP